MSWTRVLIIAGLGTLAAFGCSRTAPHQEPQPPTAVEDEKPKPKETPKDDGKPLVAYQFNSKGWPTFKLIDNGNAQRITYFNNKNEDDVVDPNHEAITNVLVVRIDGKDHVFGQSSAGEWIKKDADLGNGPDGKKRLGHRHVWRVGPVEVTQTLEVIRGKSGKLDACLIRFGLENFGKKECQVGLRQMLDTCMGDVDNHPFALPGQKDLIRYQADFKDETVPDVVLALQKAELNNPGLTATYTLNVGKGLRRPDRVAMTHTAQDVREAHQWEFPVRDIEDDAALVLWWNPRVLFPEERVEVGFAVGRSAVDLDAPAKK